MESDIVRNAFQRHEKNLERQIDGDVRVISVLCEGGFYEPFLWCCTDVFSISIPDVEVTARVRNLQKEVLWQFLSSCNSKRCRCERCG